MAAKFGNDLVVMAFPSRDFGAQEFEEADKIKNFWRDKFDYTPYVPGEPCAVRVKRS